ncbi:MAG: hypothetical protein KC900_10855 [Candidatus Omnitrophica bacterium]|nr:hypothetical protein [Candidatus Omnitrophota bacterium]
MAGMYRKADFIPYIAGTMIFGGLGAVPLIYAKLTGLGYQQALVPSLASCIVFLFAHDERGNFSFLRLIAGMALIYLTAARAAAKGNGQPFFIAGGVLGFVLMAGCGWLGIVIGRAVRGKQAVAREAEEEVKEAEKAAEETADSVGVGKIVEEDPDFEPGDSPFEKLMSQTHTSWRAGELNPLSPTCSREARNNSLQQFIAGHCLYREDIERAWKIRPFEEGEFLVNLSEGNFVTTSRALYFFKPQERVLRLNELSDYKSKGFLKMSLTVRYKNGEEQKFNDVEVLPEDEYIQYLIKEPYNAS